MTYFNPGAVSHGTLLNRDLMESLSSELERYCGAELTPACLDQRAFDAWHSVNDARAMLENEAFDCETEAGSEMVNELIDRLNSYAPDGFYFGTHEGDGSDFGFWQSSDDEFPD